MKREILAAAFLLTSAGFASADYVIIVANVGGSKELQTAPSQMAGMRGMQGGMAGMMGMRGMPGGMYGGMPRQQGPGMQGGSGQGMPSGMMGPSGGMGMASGMKGSAGGMMGMRGGMMNSPTDADEVPDYVIAVVEVKPHTKNLVKRFESLPQFPVTVDLPERLGKSCQLLKNPSFGEMFIITEGNNKPIPTVADGFKVKFENVTKNNPSSGELLDLAEWTLQHGLVNKFPTVMDKLVEADKTNLSAVAYLKVKAELERKPAEDSSAASGPNNLLENKYKVTETPHYLIVHNAVNDTALEIKTHGEHLENTFRGFYYWFALKKIALPVPTHRQIVILTNKDSDFEKLRTIFSSSPLVVDGFFARRENLPVMYSQRQDDPYKALTIFWETWKGKGYQRTELLNGKKATGSGVPVNLRGDIFLQQNAEAHMLALMLKALEQEAELATVSHEASRQLLFASGLLPRNVAVPEWLLFGVGSFFETPLQSPWPTLGAPSPYYLPRWRELKKKDASSGGLEKTRLDTLRKVVTDGYFRSLPRDMKADQTAHRLYESAIRKARTATWSLTYFLTQQKLDGLRHYFTELSKMPRDVELDDTILLGCFARAFGCVDGNNNVDDAKLKALADEWYTYFDHVYFESESNMKEIRETIVKKMKEAEEKARKQNEQNTSTQPGSGMFPGGMNPGGYSPNGPAPGGMLPPNPNPGRGGNRPRR
ncbi:MAG: DUF1570 domain-containing protein [Gemmataceae bacterium]